MVEEVEVEVEVWRLHWIGLKEMVMMRVIAAIKMEVAATVKNKVKVKVKILKVEKRMAKAKNHYQH